MPVQERERNASHRFTIRDFSPGIRTRVLRSGAGAVLGQNGWASANTFRCIPLPGGGLGPGPLRTVQYTRTAPDTIGQVTGGAFHIVGLHIDGPMIETGGAGSDANEGFVAYEWVNSSTVKRRFLLERLQLFHSIPPAVDTLENITSTQPTPPDAYRVCNFVNYRSDPNAVLPTNPTFNPVVSYAWYSGGGGDEKIWKVFPALTALGAVGTQSVSTTLALDWLVAHQGRLVGFQQTGWTHATPGAWTSDEQVWFTNPGVITIENTSASIFGIEDMSGFGAILSVSANELLLVKWGANGFTIIGPLDSPTIFRNAGVVSTGSVKTKPVYTPVGLVYAVQLGSVYAWGGGDSSVDLAPQLEDNFWQIASTKFVNYNGSFARWGTWILTPNNWLYDIDSKSWWQIDDPSDRAFFHLKDAPNGQYVYACPVTFTGTAPFDAVLYRFDRSLPALSYRWQSQPIEETIDTVVECRNVYLEAIGNGTVTVTLIGFNGASEAHTFTLTSNSFIQKMRLGFTLQGSHIQVQIDSSGASSAPVVYEVSVDYDERSLVQPT